MVTTQMIHHLLSKMGKESSAPLEVSVGIAVDNQKDSVQLRLDLFLVTFQLRNLDNCSGNILRNILDVMVFVQYILDIWEVHLQDGEGITVPILNDCLDIDIFRFEPFGNAFHTK